MKEFLATYPLAVWSTVSTLAALVVVAALWDRVKWWWMNTWYSFPFIGKIERLSHDLNRCPGDSEWYKAERTLCQDYKGAITIQSEYDFKRADSYLNKAGDNGRHDTPLPIWILTCALIFIEAKGFSYVLAGYTIPGASENLQELASNGIAFLISAIAVVLTHLAGHELYRSRKIVNARREWVESRKSHNLMSRSITLNDPQHIDDGEPPYTQLTNRVGHLPGFPITYSTIAFIIIIAVGATYVRVQTAYKLMDEDVRVQSMEKPAKQAGQSGLDMGAKDGGMPDAVLKSSKEADDQITAVGRTTDMKAYWATFILLAFLFVFLQVISIMFGYRWGFAGRNSKDAYRALGRGKYATYSEVAESYQRIKDKAQSKLEDLQQRMMDRDSQGGTQMGIHPTGRFSKYLEEAEAEAEAVRQQQHEAAKRRMQQELEQHEADLSRLEAARKLQTFTQSVSQPAPIPSMPKPPPAPVAAPVPAATRVIDPNPIPVIATELSEIDKAVAHFDALGDDESATDAYMESLPNKLYQDVLEALRVRHLAQEAERAKRKSDYKQYLGKKA
jgi:hypothetical protein